MWRLGKDENSAFENLKKIFASEPVLAQWDPDRETVLEADSSGYAMGGCLSQVDDQNTLRPVAYFSRRLNSAEANYSIHNKEMHSIVSCLDEWKAELLSVAKPFTILSDHKNLNYFTSKRLLNKRQMRYNDILQQFRFVLKWRPGNTCERPDALSRRDQDRPVGLSDERNAGRVLQLLPNVSLYPVSCDVHKQTQRMEPKASSDDVSVAKIGDPVTDVACGARIFDDEVLQGLWREGVLADKSWRRARDSVKMGHRSFPPDLALHHSANIAECTVAADGVLRGRENRIWVPDYEPLQTAIMQRTHDSHLAGHPGRDTMISMILRRWFWPKMRESVRRFVRNCDVCGRSTVWREAKAGFMRSLPIPERIGSELSIDFITDLPKSRGCTNIMVITDRLSKDIFLFGAGSVAGSIDGGEHQSKSKYKIS